jgi:PAS domain S-box-containing protein
MADAGITINSTKSLQLLYELSSRLATSFDLQSSIELILSLSMEYLETERGSLVVLEDKIPIDAALMYNNRIFFNNAAQFTDVVKRGLVAWVIENRQAAFVNNTTIDPRWLKRADDQPDHTGAKSSMCFPLEVEDTIVGVLTIVHPSPDYFTQEQFDFLQVAAKQAAFAIQNSKRYSKLMVSEQYYQSLFKDNIMASIVTTANGEIIEANQAALELVQMDAATVCSKTIYSLHQAPLHILSNGFDELLMGETEDYDALMHLENGETIQVRFFVRMLPSDPNGRLLWIMQDITQQRQMESMRSDLSAMIYHDIRSPLANVISSLELLKVMLPEHDDVNIDDVLNLIARSTNRVQRLVSNLLDIGRLEEKHNYIDLEEIDVRELVSNIIADVKPIVDSRKQTVECQIADSVSDVWVDEDMVKRILINLLENAAKYSPMKETILFKINRMGSGALRFIVADNGPGIPKNQLESIFEKFTRVGDRKGPKGIGLGLAFCKLAVGAHGGKIWAESDGVQGTRFIFDLPNLPPES